VCNFGGVSIIHSISFLLEKIIIRLDWIISMIIKINKIIEIKLIKEPKEDKIFQDKWKSG